MFICIKQHKADLKISTFIHHSSKQNTTIENLVWPRLFMVHHTNIKWPSLRLS